MPDNPQNTDRPKGAIRQENERIILSAAEDVFSEEGFRGASVGMIAERAGVPKPNVYYYFGSKEELYKRVLEDICAAWLDSAGEFDDAADPKAALTAYVSAKMDLARARPKGSRVWATEMTRGAEHLSAYLRDAVDPWVKAREATLMRWINAGKMAAVDPRAYIFMIWATTQHYADFEAQITHLNGGKPLSDSDFAAKKASVIAMVLAAAGL